MCLGIPMQIETIDGFVARCTAKGVTRNVNVFLMQDETLMPGDYVMVHVGYAITKISPTLAQSAWALHDEMMNRRRSAADA